MDNSLFLWIEENGPRSCPWSFVSVVIAILFPLLTLQEQIHFDLYNLRNWNWNASKSFIVLKNDFSSEIPPFYGRGNRFSIAFCLLFYPTFQIFPLVLHILFSNHKPVDFWTVLFFRTQKITFEIKENEEPRIEMDRRRSTAGRMREATVSWSLLSPRGRSIISRQLSLTESRRENEFYDTRFPPPINDTFLLATSPDRKSQIKPRDLL